MNPNWATIQQKYDPRHWLGILLQVVSSKMSVLFPIFAIACAMCLFKPMKGEYNRVLEHVRYQYPGITAAKIAAIPWRYFRRMMRMVCPSPLIIMRELRDTFEVFALMVDPETKRFFFSPGWRSVLQKQLKYVARGLLSDNPFLSSYIKCGTMLSGFELSRSLRTSSHLEGYHVHLRRLVEYAYASGELWLESIINSFDFRWCVAAARRFNMCDPDVKHFNLQLRDVLQNALLALPFKEPRLLPSHRVVLDRAPIMHHGGFFSREALRIEAADDDDDAVDDEAGAAAAVAAVAAAAPAPAPQQVRRWRLKPSDDEATELIKLLKSGESELVIVARHTHRRGEPIRNTLRVRPRVVGRV